MHGHLVAVEVGIEWCACQRVQLDGLALDELGLEGLDTQAVQCWGTVEHDGVTLHHVFQDVPHHGFLAVDNLLGALHRLHDAALDELAYHEGLVELGSHVLRNTALAHLELRTHDDDRAGRVVDTLAQQVLAEAALLALEAVAQRLERAIGIALHSAALAGVVEQRVDGFLKHALLVAQDDLGSLDLDEALEAVVAYDDSTVQVVEIAGGKTAAIEGHERAQLGRNHRNHLEYHPLGTVHVLALAEGFDHLQALQGLGLALLRGLLVGLVAQLIGERVEVELHQEVVDSLGTHLGHKLVGVVVVELVIVFRQLLHDVHILVLAQQVETLQWLRLLARLLGHLHVAGIDHDVALIVDHCIELLGGQAQQVAYLVGQRAEVPDMGHGHHQLDVAAALTAHLLLGDLDTATVAHDALVAYALVLAAMALIVLYRAEDALAEQAVALGLVGAVVDGFWLEHLAIGVVEYLVGRCQRDGYLGEVTLCFIVFSKSHLKMY